MALFDQAARYSIKLDPAGYLRWLLEGIGQELVFTRWLETQTIPFPGEPDHRCDTVAELVPSDGLGPPWALVAEAQTYPEADILARLMEYMARLWRELRHGPHGRDRYRVAGALVTLTGSGPSPEVDMVLPGPAGLGFRWRPGGRVLANEDAAGTLGQIAAGDLTRALLPWVVLMRGGGDPAVIADWRRLAGAEADSRRRAEYGALALHFAELTGWQEAWQQALEGWAVEESPFLNAIEARGRFKERLEVRRDVLLRVVRAKFPGPVPPEVSGAITSQANAEELLRWFDLAEAASSIEQLRSALGIGVGRPDGSTASDS